MEVCSVAQFTVTRVLGLGPLVIAGLLFLCPLQAQTAQPVEVKHPAWFKDSLLDMPADLQEARDAGKTGLMLFFGTRTCSYCHAFLEKTFGQPEIVERVRASFDVIGFEVMSDDEVVDFQGKTLWAKDFAVQERARFTPTLAFYGEDGRLLLHMVGYVGPERFTAALDYLEAGAYEHQSLRAYLEAREAPRAEPARPVIRDQALFAAAPVDLDRRGGDAQRPLVVVFERPDCDTCERLHRTVLTVPSLRASIGRFEAVQLDMSDTNSRVVTPDGESLSPRDWAARLGLTHAPALVFFDVQGNEVLRTDTDLLVDAHGRPVDAVNPRITANVQARLDYVLEQGYREQPQFQRWRRTCPRRPGW
jgi:thioredoxin-related protein